MRGRAALLAAGLLAAGCATTTLAPVTGPGVALEGDERRLWQRSEEEQRVLDGSGLLYADAELEAYLNGVARRLEPPEVYVRIPFAIRVIRNPRLNAFAFPNGVVYVHTGMLATLENEAQLATLLAHEMTHATHRHAVRELRHTKSRAAWLAGLRTTLGGLPALGGLAGVLGEVGTAAAVTGYSRDLEREADAHGLALVARAGYDPAEAPKLFHALKREAEREKVEVPLFYATHPRLDERIETFETLLGTEYRDRKGGVTNAEAFLHRTSRVVLDNARLDLKAGRFDAAREGAERYLARAPGDPHGHYLLGEVLRQQGGEAGVAAAGRHYRKAIAIDRAFADPHRELGLIHFKRGEKRKAKRFLEAYLALAPTAPDRAYIEEYIRQCR